jgi:hypothetical protein
VVNEPTLPPLPNKGELEASGNLYAQVIKRNPSVNIIAHLRSPVWWPWVERGQLTRPELLHRDLSAYKALSKWTKKPGNNLSDALGGHDIPSISEVNDALVQSVERPGDMPARAYWALSRRISRRK